MKDLIRKVLKEAEEDEFSWLKDSLNPEKAEAKLKHHWKRVGRNHGVEVEDIYDLLTGAGFADLNALDQLISMLEDQYESVYDSGRTSGHEDCDCEGCCDDYIYYEDHRSEVDQARDEGYESGVDDGKSEMRDEMQGEIDELRDKISELESEIERLQEEGSGDE